MSYNVFRLHISSICLFSEIRTHNLLRYQCDAVSTKQHIFMSFHVISLMSRRNNCTLKICGWLSGTVQCFVATQHEWLMRSPWLQEGGGGKERRSDSPICLRPPSRTIPISYCLTLWGWHLIFFTSWRVSWPHTSPDIAHNGLWCFGSWLSNRLVPLLIKTY